MSSICGSEYHQTLFNFTARILKHLQRYKFDCFNDPCKKHAYVTNANAVHFVLDRTAKKKVKRVNVWGTRWLS